MLAAVDCRSRAELRLVQISRECDTKAGLMPEPDGRFCPTLAGNGPILVSKLSGTVEVAGSDLPVEEYIRQFGAREAAGLP